jgi:hypothetical protein
VSDALRPIDVICPDCGANVGDPCRVTAEEKRRGIKSTHPGRFAEVRMSRTGANLRAARRASESPIPFASPLVVFLWNAGTRTSANHLRFATAVEDKIKLLTGRRRKIYCVWPGENRSDLFFIDEPDKVLHVLKEDGFYRRNA